MKIMTNFNFKSNVINEFRIEDIYLIQKYL